MAAWKVVNTHKNKNTKLCFGKLLRDNAKYANYSQRVITYNTLVWSFYISSIQFNIFATCSLTIRFCALVFTCITDNTQSHKGDLESPTCFTSSNYC